MLTHRHYSLPCKKARLLFINKQGTFLAMLKYVVTEMTRIEA
jgi:hypothetical protein